MKDSEIVREVLKRKSQMMDKPTGDALRNQGLSPDAEQQFWADFEESLDNLKNTIPGLAVEPEVVRDLI